MLDPVSRIPFPELVHAHDQGEPTHAPGIGRGGVMPIKGVLFDVDDTLFDYSASDQAGLLTHLRAQQLLDRFPDAATAVGLWRAIMEVHFARYLNGEQTLTGQQRERTREFLSHLGYRDLSDREASAWFAGYEIHRNATWAAFPDAEPVLRRLAPDYRLGVVSNASVDHQRHKLQAIGLLHYVGDAVVCADQHGASKPAPSIFLAGCASLELAPDEVAYVGDKYSLDAEGASDAGLHAYWLDRGFASYGHDVRDGIRVIHSLDELPDALTG
jgi:putative hydrolase of the HAD superfamily